MKINIWVDLDNTPHVQFILPVALALKSMGGSVCITARDSGQVVRLLELRNIEAKVIGRAFPKTTRSKILHTVWRACRLMLYVGKYHPEISLSSSRAAALASRLLSIKSFIFCDFENAELKSYQRLGSFLVFPEVIPDKVFRNIGFTREKLIPYPGLKENITLDGFIIPKVCPLPSLDLTKTIVLLRPPSFSTHYHQQITSDLFSLFEQYLLQRIEESQLQIVILPRNTKQAREYVGKYGGLNDIFVLERAVDGSSLIWFSDLVISAGGTMAREAACLGARSYSLLQTESGSVDRYLESIGKLVFIRGEEDFGKLRFGKVHERIFHQESYRGFASKVALMIMGKVGTR